jgi:outer membrane protein W
MIDTLSAEMSTFDGGDTMAFSLWGETAMATPDGDWSFLLGGRVGTESPDGAEDANFWNLGLGMKHYFTHLTSLALVGAYTEYDVSYDLDVKAASLSLKHRFISAIEPISPFVTVGATYQTINKPWNDASGDSFSELVGKIGVGCDFMMTEDMAIVLSAAYFNAEDVSDGPNPPDGWMATLSMMYYWGD